MAKKESQKSLDSWTKEEWGTKSGKNSTQGKNATGERYLPKKARESLSDKERLSVLLIRSVLLFVKVSNTASNQTVAKKTAKHRR